MAQVKFYSVSELPETASTTGAGGVYFVDGGELYKGANRFGANKVFTVPSDTDVTGEGFNLASALSAASVAGAIGGDILTGYGAAKVFNGSTWVDLGADVSSIIGQISDSTSTSTANGITVSVTTSDGYVTGVQVAAADISATSVTAGSGTFTNLTVSDTATFSATTVSASSLTVGGSTVNQIAQAEIAAVTANTITATGTSLPTESAVATYVSAAVSNLAGAMHFKGTATITKTGEAITVSNFSETFTPAGGDVVVDTTNNLEAVYTGSAWELLGSNSVYALDAYAPGEEDVTAGTTTLGGAVHAIASAFDNLGTAASKNYADSLTAAGTSLPTESAVATYVTGVVAGLDATVSASENTGVQVQVTQADGVVTGVTADLVWLGANDQPLA